MTLRLYLDEDSMDQDLVRALRARGVDVVTALDDGMIERADEDHLLWAATQARVLFSFNVGVSTVYTPTSALKVRFMPGVFSHHSNGFRSANSCVASCGSSPADPLRRCGIGWSFWGPGVDTAVAYVDAVKRG